MGRPFGRRRRRTRTTFGTGRELFASFRDAVGRADQGAHVFGPATPALTHLQETR